MGKINAYKCNNCERTWRRHEGRGFDSLACHCDKCGKEKLFKIGTTSTKRPCKCGGAFGDRTCAICSYCKSKDVVRHGDASGLWD